MTTKKPSPRRARASSAPATSAAAVTSAATTPATSVAAPETRRHQIEVEAYLLAERRGFAPGGELGDWLEAERIIADRADRADRAGVA